jgi:pycsar effector protein
MNTGDFPLEPEEGASQHIGPPLDANPPSDANPPLDANPPSDAPDPLPKKSRKKKRKADKGLPRGVETMFRTSYRVHMDLSGLADAKANIMISINGIIISIIIASISPKIDTNPWLLVPTSVLLLACLLSIVFAVRSARPRVSNEAVSLADVKAARANILFFGHFVSLSQQDYLDGMTDLLNRPDALYNQMMRDIYSLGKILQRKFQLLRIAYTVFMIGLIFGITLFIAVYIWIVVSLDATAVLDLFSGPWTAQLV